MTEQQFNQMATDIAVIKSELTHFTQTQIPRIDDHEERIRSVEDFKSRIMGAMLASGVIGGVVGALIPLLLKGFS